MAPATTNTSSASGSDRGNGIFVRACERCRGGPAAGGKLQVCSGCKMVHYCSIACQTEGWADHKLICKDFSAARQRSVAAIEAEAEQGNSAPGRGSKQIKTQRLALNDWYCSIPGLPHKVQFLGWKYRSQSPVIVVVTLSTIPGSVPVVSMVPRTQWDIQTTSSVPDDAVILARSVFARSDFHADRTCLVCMQVLPGTSGLSSSMMSPQSFSSTMPAVHESVLMTLTADEFAAEATRRQGDPAAVYVRLTGLIGAAYLNGREGVLRGRDPNNAKRFKVVLEGGKEVVSVKIHNYASLRRPRLLKKEF